MQGSQVPDYLTFDDKRGRHKRGCEVYFYEEKNINTLKSVLFFFFNFKLGHFVSLSFDIWNFFFQYTANIFKERKSKNGEYFIYTKSKYIPNLDGIEEIDKFVVAFLIFLIS